MHWSAIIVAAGTGTRFGRPKQLVPLAGRPVVAWSLQAFLHIPEISEIIVVGEGGEQEAFYRLIEQYGRDREVRFAVGGPTRQASVAAGMRILAPTTDAVLVHDGARPLVQPDDILRCMRAVRPGQAAIIATPIIDTVKKIDERGQIRATLDRTNLWAAQTPQAASYRDLESAHRAAERSAFQGTDEASLLERVGVEVAVIPGSSENIKITRPVDLIHAQVILETRGKTEPQEEELYLLEAFVADSAVNAVIAEIEAHHGDIDGIDRELPQGVAVRAYLSAEHLERFRARFHLVAGHSATYTTRVLRTIVAR